MATAFLMKSRQRSSRLIRLMCSASRYVAPVNGLYDFMMSAIVA